MQPAKLDQSDILMVLLLMNWIHFLRLFAKRSKVIGQVGDLVGAEDRARKRP